MKKEDLYSAMGDINESYVGLAHSPQKSPRPVWVKLLTAAACLCLVAVAVFTVPDIIAGFVPEDIGDPYANTVAYAGWSDDKTIYENALNKESLQNGKGRKLPVLKIDTLEELEQFKTEYGSIFNMEYGFSGALSFEGAIKKAQWDREDFYTEHSLLVIYLPASSSAYRYGVQEVKVKDSSICVCVEQKNDPEAVTADMAGWFILVSVEDEEIKNYTTLDAVLN